MKSVSGLFLALLFCLLPLFDATKAFAKDELLDEILSRRELRVGVSPGFVPFVVDGEEARELKSKVIGDLPIDSKTGVCGFDVELARAIARSLEIRLTLIKAKDLYQLQELLNQGEIDMALSGLTRTLERAWSFYLSDPYFVSGLIILVPKNSPVRELKELNNEKHELFVKLSSTSENFARRYLPNANIASFSSEEVMFEKLQESKTASIVIDAIKAQSYRMSDKLSSDFRRLEGRRFTDEYFGILLPRDYSLLHYVNLFIESYKRSGKFHDLASRFNPWFRSED